MVHKVHLIPDRYHLTNLGRLHNGNYFWIDLQLASEGGETRDFVATYFFDNAGDLIHHKIIDLGLRSSSDALSAKEIIEQERTRLGEWEHMDFWVKPFSINAHDLVFGLVIRDRQPGELDGYQAVDAMPGWTLMFYPPWEDGQYDT